MSEKRIKIINGNLITPSRIIKGEVLITGAKISDIHEGKIDAPDATILDAGGQYVAPGLIDLHVHGGGGHDFMDGTVGAFLNIAQIHARFGTTAMVPTTLTSDKATILNTLEVYEQANVRNIKGAQFLGMHIEGPYFAMEQRGAQDPRYIRDPDPAEYLEILNSTTSIARWSVAPEKKGAIEFGRILKSRGIIASIAHTDAIYADVVEAFGNGYTLVTHLYSGMAGVTRRNAFRHGGVVEAAFLLDEMDVEIIADGRHLPAELLQLVHKIKGPAHVALITDAMRAAGMHEETSILGSIHDGIPVIIEDEVAKLPDRSAFAGSVATADRLLRNMVHMAGIPLTDAIQMAAQTPARIMGATRKGVLAAGNDADIIFLDANLHVSKTIIGGQLVYEETTTL